nr:hypothetical protein [Mitsuokella multacida]
MLFIFIRNACYKSGRIRIEHGKCSIFCIILAIKNNAAPIKRTYLSRHPIGIPRKMNLAFPISPNIALIVRRISLQVNLTTSICIKRSLAARHCQIFRLPIDQAGKINHAIARFTRPASYVELVLRLERNLAVLWRGSI